MTADEIRKEIMYILDGECMRARLLLVANDIEMYGEVGEAEKKELESIREEYEETAEKIGNLIE